MNKISKTQVSDLSIIKRFFTKKGFTHRTIDAVNKIIFFFYDTP